jgi:hypothetical protein
MDGKLIDACALLLGPQVRRNGSSILQQLDVAAVRRAYRVLAIATHPDATWRSGARHSDGRRFIEASRAYELLMGYLLSGPSFASRGASPRAEPSRGQGPQHSGAERRGTGEKSRTGDWRTTEEKRGGGRAGDTCHARSTGHAHASGGSRGAPLFYRGSVPRRRLRLAEFLYYSGRVSWQSLISAIVWQRALQPKFGELAREMQSISGPELSRILVSRMRHEQTGEAAQRLRLLTAAQVDRILRMQRARRRLIGRYFVEKQIMDGEVLHDIMRELHWHNAHYARQA